LSILYHATTLFPVFIYVISFSNSFWYIIFKDNFDTKRP